MNTTTSIRSFQSGSQVSPIPLGYAAEPAAGNSLYSPQSVGIATFLGTPFAGSIVMAVNYRRLGRSGSALNTLVCGALATALLLAAGFLLPLEHAGYLFATASLMITIKIAKSLQGETVARHQAAGGQIASQWKAAGIGLTSLAVLFAIIFAIISMTTPSTGKSVTVGRSQIFYAGSSTNADALALGKALTDAGFLDDTREVSVLLSKGSATTTIKFVVNEQSGHSADVLNDFTNLTKQIAPAIGGTPLTLKLVSPDLKVLQSTTVE